MADLSETAATGDPFAELLKIVARLRAPDGCPWDRAQTVESLLPALIEEAYEVAGALRARDDANLREELGDLLLVIVMQAQIAAEEGRFTIAEIAHEAREKLVRRHPHVFGDTKLRESEGVLRQWEAIKRAEKKDDSHFLASLPAALPALMRAQKAQKKAARVNFDWKELRDVITKVDEELAETRDAIEKWHRHPADVSQAENGRNDEIAEEIGDLLFAVVNLARKCQLDAEGLLQNATDKFVRRFNEMENRLRSRGRKLGEATLEELDVIWNEIKAERNPA